MTVTKIKSANFSRRALLGSSAALGVGLTTLGAEVASAGPRRPSSGTDRASARRAVSFLQGVLDAYETSGPRIAQSYFDGSGLQDLGFTYDNALALIALLSAGDVARARAIGDAFVYAQNHDDGKQTDGRLRQTYHADSFTNADGTAHSGWEIGLTVSTVGDMSWAGIALAQLAHATKRAEYRDAAVRIAEWVEDRATDAGLGGYTFGEHPDLKGHKSTEHNIDVYAFFRLIAQLTGQNRWLDGAQHAWDFVERVWNAEDGFFWTGSNDGSTINKNAAQFPLDAQTWAWLAARRARYAGALDWAAANLATTDTPLRLNSELTGNQVVSGVAFASGSVAADTSAPIDPWHGKPDSGAVWFEGTSQLALSLADRNRRGDRAAADELLGAVRWAQAELGDGQEFGGKRINGGIVAASSPLQTGFGFGYYQHLHVGATSWYVFAATGTNPYRFL
jgi:hypothetical protein